MLFIAEEHALVVLVGGKIGGRMFAVHLNEGLARRLALRIVNHVNTLMHNVLRMNAQELKYLLDAAVIWQHAESHAISSISARDHLRR